MSRYQNDGIETDAYELVDIWFKVRSHSSVFKEVAQSITTSDHIGSEIMARSLKEVLGG